MTDIETDDRGLHRERHRRSRVRADHPHLLAALREELDITSPKDGCSPSGQCGCCTVLIDGKASRGLPARRWPRSRGGRSHPRGLRPRTSGSATPTRSPPAAACSAASASPASSCGPRPRSTRRAPTSPASDMARHLGAHLCRCTGYVKVLDAIEAVAAGKELAAGLPRRRRRPAAPSTRRASCARRPRLRRRPPRARHAARRPPPDRPRPRRRRPNRHRRRRGGARAWSRCSPRPTSRASCGSASSTRTGRS